MTDRETTPHTQSYLLLTPSSQNLRSQMAPTNPQTLCPPAKITSTLTKHTQRRSTQGCLPDNTIDHPTPQRNTRTPIPHMPEDPKASTPKNHTHRENPLWYDVQ
jgi:hypothetical protein